MGSQPQDMTSVIFRRNFEEFSKMGGIAKIEAVRNPGDVKEFEGEASKKILEIFSGFLPFDSTSTTLSW